MARPWAGVNITPKLEGARSKLALPLPAAPSSTRTPARTAAASARLSPRICSVVPITA